jgi:hypothetical protein
MIGMTFANGRNGAAVRLCVMLAMLGGLAAALALAPAAQAQGCSNARKAKNVRAFGVSCRQAKKVVAEDVSRNKCRNRCSFRKVGYRWSCEQRPSGLNSCEYRFGTSRYTVTFKYTGD